MTSKSVPGPRHLCAVLEAKSSEVEQPRGYLHQAARNIAVDAFRREDYREAMILEAYEKRTQHTDEPERFMRAIQLAMDNRFSWLRDGQIKRKELMDYHPVTMEPFVKTPPHRKHPPVIDCRWGSSSTESGLDHEFDII